MMRKQTMKKMTFRELVEELEKDVEVFGDCLIDNFVIVGSQDYQWLVWDVESMMETDEKYADYDWRGVMSYKPNEEFAVCEW